MESTSEHRQLARNAAAYPFRTMPGIERDGLLSEAMVIVWSTW